MASYGVYWNYFDVYVYMVDIVRRDAFRGVIVYYKLVVYV